MSEKIDKTKENVGISDLNENIRKDLFNKFKEAGGEVVDERKKTKALIIDRDKQRKHQQKVDSHRKNINKTSVKKVTTPARRVDNKRKIIETNEISTFMRFINKIRIKIKLTIYRVTQFNGEIFNPKFIERFDRIYKMALIEVQLVYFDLFQKDPELGNRVLSRLDKLNPIYYELIAMIAEITNDNIINNLSYEVGDRLNVLNVKEKIIELYKRLVVLKQYENIIYSSFEKAIVLKMKIEEKKSSISSQQKRKVKKDLFIIFHNLFPRLHLLFCHFNGELLQVDDPRIDGILSITGEDKPGNRVVNDPLRKKIDVEEENDSGDEEEEEKEDIIELPEPVKNGLKMMYSLNLENLRDEYDKANLFEHLGMDDKILLTYLFFTEFDKEYSSILTTNKIKYNVSYSDEGTMNYRIILQDIYDEMRKSFGAFKDYSETTILYNKAKGQKPENNDFYIQWAKRLTGLEKKCEESSQRVRMSVKALMRKISIEFEKIIMDMDNEQRYIENPQEILEFQVALEGNSKINGKKVYEAINLAYYYSSAFYNRLNHNGDLYGKGKMNDNSNESVEEKEKDSAPDDELIGELEDDLTSFF